MLIKITESSRLLLNIVIIQKPTAEKKPINPYVCITKEEEFNLSKKDNDNVSNVNAAIKVRVQTSNTVVIFS